MSLGKGVCETLTLENQFTGELFEQSKGDRKLSGDSGVQ